MPSPTRQDGLAGRIIERLAQDSGQEVQFRLVELWNNWKIVMGPLAGLAVPLGHRGKKLVIAAEDSFLEGPYFTECQVKLRLGQKDLLNREEAPCVRPPEKAAASGVWLSEMDPGSPVARCYRAFAARGKDSGQ